MATFRVKRQDTTLPLSAHTDISGATVQAFIRTMGAEGEVPATVPVEITGAAAGDFDLVLSDIDSGDFDLEVRISRDGEDIHIPESGFDRLVIDPNLDDPLSLPYEPSETLQDVIERAVAVAVEAAITARLGPAV